LTEVRKSQRLVDGAGRHNRRAWRRMTFVIVRKDEPSIAVPTCHQLARSVHASDAVDTIHTRITVLKIIHRRTRSRRSLRGIGEIWSERRARDIKRAVRKAQLIAVVLSERQLLLASAGTLQLSDVYKLRCHWTHK